MSTGNHQNERLLRDAMIEWASDGRYSHAITLCPNKNGLSLGNLQRLFSRFCLGVDRLMLGRDAVRRIATAERFDAIAFPEHLESNAHLHVAANLRRCVWRNAGGYFTMEHDLVSLWQKVTDGSGELLIKDARDRGWATYITKDFYRHGQDYMLAADFHPNDRVLYSPQVRDVLELLRA